MSGGARIEYALGVLLVGAATLCALGTMNDGGHVVTTVFFSRATNHMVPVISPSEGTK